MIHFQKSRRGIYKIQVYYNKYLMSVIQISIFINKIFKIACLVVFISKLSCHYFWSLIDNTFWGEYVNMDESPRFKEPYFHNRHSGYLLSWVVNISIRAYYFHDLYSGMHQWFGFGFGQLIVWVFHQKFFKHQVLS